MKIDFTLPVIGEEQRAIGGGYTAQEQVIVSFKNRSILYILGSISMDTSCCGSRSWNYIQVIGYLLNTPPKNNETGSPLKVDTIEDPNEKITLQKILAEKYPGARIEFR
jgi:hypothetical protein